jgi:endonuclease YncB( thermonuclease family)
VLAVLLLSSSAVPVVAAERLAGTARVVDGHTLDVAGVRVRLKGVAAPEVAHAGDPGERGGEAAKAFMVELAEGRTVVCELTGERSRGRRVGYCSRDGRDLGAEVIAAGLARDCPRFSGAGTRRRGSRRRRAACRSRPTAGRDRAGGPIGPPQARNAMLVKNQTARHSMPPAAASPMTAHAVP